MRRLALLLTLFACVVLPRPAAADAGADPACDAAVDGGDDGSAPTCEDIPEGSVGQGGADRDNPEGEDSTGRVPTTCGQSADCASGFVCERGKCRYRGIREAEGGFCGGLFTVSLWSVIVGVVRKWRRAGDGV